MTWIERIMAAATMPFPEHFEKRGTFAASAIAC
jgi:hypothetical protein